MTPKKADKGGLSTEERQNPYVGISMPTAKTDNYKLNKSFKAHDLAVSA